MRWIAALAFLVVLAANPAALHAHGGTYIGPGDLVPPGGGGAAPVPPATPITPPTPGTASPTPGTPASPGTPAAIPPPLPLPPPSIPETGGLPADDLTRWIYWWEVNKRPYLNLKAKIQDGGTLTGEGELLAGLSPFSFEARGFRPTEEQISRLVLPALRLGLADPNIDVRSSCAIALAKVSAAPETAGLLVPLLRAGQPEVEETAALALGILRAPEVLPILRALAWDNDEGRRLSGRPEVALRTRAFAAYGLGLLADSAEDPLIRAEIAADLARLARSDTSILPDLRVAAVIALGLTRPADPAPLIESLHALLDDSRANTLVRAHVPQAIARLVVPDRHTSLAEQAARAFLRRIEKGAKEPSAVRQSAVQALGLLAPACGDAVRFEVLTALLADADHASDIQEKNFAAIALARLGAAVPADHPIRAEVLGFLVRRVAKGDSHLRPWAGLALGVMSFHAEAAGTGPLPDLAPAAVLDAFQRERNPAVRSAHATALGLMRHAAAQDEVAEVMTNQRDPELRGYCAVALGLMDARAHGPEILAMVKESKRQPELLRQASVALGLLGEREACPTLIELLLPLDGNDPPLSVLAAAAASLGFIGDYRSVVPLVAVMGDTRQRTPLARAFAAAALGMVADRDDLPWNAAIAEEINYRASVYTLTDPSGCGVLDIL